MRIKEFIQQQVILPRLQEAGVLVVYDQEQRYRELCLELAGERRLVVDASESSIESRAAALEALQQLGQQNRTLDALLIYVPAPAPRDDEARQRDPFSIYAVCGAVFPDPTKDGDEFQSLCLRARADHATEIRRIFQQSPSPAFAVIDAVGGGAGWPNLQAVLGVESARDILFALLAPSKGQQDNLRRNSGWVAEASQLLQAALGLRLRTQEPSWEAIVDELWGYLLFSEFVFDLPVALPTALAEMPRAQREALPLIEDLCERLRNDRRTQELYITRAEGLERTLGLPDACREIVDLGVRDTFPFEERSFFTQAIEALKRDNADRLRELLGRHTHSIWSARGENRAQWQLLQTAASLIEACQDADRELADQVSSQVKLIDFYLGSLRQVDRLQRELEQAAGDYVDASGLLDEAKRQARSAYQKLSARIQSAFIRHVEKSGWPPAGRLANADVFDRMVAPKLQESGRKVALLLIDALRYELGVELQKQLGERVQADLHAAYVQLPSVTPVGMASLLPGAGQQLRLAKKEDGMVPALGDQTLAAVGHRMEVLRKRYGQRFDERSLADFIKSGTQLAETVELLVLRSNEMDSQFENNPDTAPGLISRTFQQIVGALHKLRTLGFQDAIIVTDHGFYLNTAAGAGDVCAKPPGKWLNVHDRMLLGDGSGDSNNLVMPAEQLGIRGEFNQAAVPRALVAYKAGLSYFHGGVSLQEAIVPVIAARLTTVDSNVAKPPRLVLTYKRGARKVTTRLPVIVVEVEAGDMFWGDQTFDILLEAHAKSGEVVGQAWPGGAVNAATRTVTLAPDAATSVTLRMDDAFEGKFTVKAIDPTTRAVFHTIELETDYTV